MQTKVGMRQIQYLALIIFAHRAYIECQMTHYFDITITNEAINIYWMQ